MKKLLSLSLALIMTLALSIPAFASEANLYPFSDDIIYAEVKDGTIQAYSPNNIIVMTAEQALQLGHELQAIAKGSELVYIAGDISPVSIANAAGLPAPGETESLNDDGTVKDIAVAIDCIDGELYISEVAIKSDNLDALVNSRSVNITMDGIKAALFEDSVSEVSTDGLQAYSLPNGHDKYSNKETTVYDNNNTAVGTMRFYARYYNRGSWTSGYMFDTIVKATFAPESNYRVEKVFVTLGHTSTSSKYAKHEIIDETYIPSAGTETSFDIGLDASADGVGVGVGASWSYSSEAINVTNDFTDSDRRIWTFEPVDSRAGNALSQEPGIRSVAKSSSGKYTTITLSCPFYGFWGNVTENNYLSWNITW